MKFPSRLIITFVAVFFLAVSVKARTLSPIQALHIAENFKSAQASTMAVGTSSPGKPVLSLAHTAKLKDNTTPAYYVFNCNQSDGFVVVSGDDRFNKILGFTSKGNFQNGAIPSNVEWWLNEYEKQMEYYLHNNSDVSAANLTGRSDKPVILPLLSTQWGQDSPYNGLCPEYDGLRCVTGCVATAMAQIMKYHNYPVQGNGSYSYTPSKFNQEISFDFGSTTFDWGNMADVYDGNTTEQQNDAVATLMLACGVSVNMNYSPTSSGAIDYNVPYAMQKYFGYSKSVDFDDRDGYTDEEWEDLVYNEIVNHRPVLYCGSGNGSHAFVCDGYSGNGYFHINWGWGGKYDGNFLLSALNPGGAGIGGGGGEYNTSQQVIYGIKPSDGGETVGQNFTLFSYGNFTYKGNNTFNIDGDLFIVYNGTYEVPLGIMVVSEDNPEIVNFFPSETSLNFLDVRPDNPSFDYHSVTFAAQPTGLSAGKYIVYPAYTCPDGTHKRLRCPITEKTSVNLTVTDGGVLEYEEAPVAAKLSVISCSVPEVISEGENVAISVIVKNTSSDLYNGKIYIHIRKKGENTDVMTFEETLILPPTAEKKVEKQPTFNVEPGEYEIIVTDNDGNLADSEPITFIVGNLPMFEINGISLKNIYSGEFADMVLKITNPTPKDISSDFLLNFYRKGSEERSFYRFGPPISVAGNSTVEYLWSMFNIGGDVAPGFYDLQFCDAKGNPISERFDVNIFVKSGDVFWFSTDNNENAILGKSPKTPYSGDLIIPETFSYENTVYPLIAISDDAFENCKDLSKVLFNSKSLNLENAPTVFATLPVLTEVYFYTDIFTGYSDILTALECKIYSIIESLTIDIPDEIFSGSQFEAIIAPKPENKWFNPTFQINVSDTELIQLVSLSPISESSTVIANFNAKGDGDVSIVIANPQPEFSGIEKTLTIKKPAPLAPAEITLNSNGITLREGETFQLEAVIVPDDAEGEIIWFSSDNEVATVDETGKVTAISPGNATIKASIGELSASCEVTVEREVVKPTDIALNVNEIKLTEGESFQLEAVIVPDDADGEIIWVSSDGEVATVDETGKVTAISPGIALITAKVGELSASCEVTVERKVVKPTDIALNVTEIKLIEGESFQLETVIVPEDAEGEIIWSSSDEEVAAVDESGKVTAISPGNATIKASIGELSASCDVTVEKKVIKPTDIALNVTEIELIEGESFQLEASVVPDDAEGDIIWSSSDESVATVDETGKVTAISPGNATIKASIGDLSATCEVTVERKVVKPIDITLNVTEIELIEGEFFQLEAVIVPEDADGEIIWSSSDEEIATVDETGKVTAISSGNTTIKASIGELSASCEVTVEKKVIIPTDITLNVTEIKLTEGESFQLEAVIVPDDAEGEIIWFTSDNDVATVDETGKVTAISHGHTTIKASIGELSASCDVSVERKVIKPTDIALNVTEIKLIEGESFQLEAVIVPEDAEGEIIWSSSDDEVATVDETGKVTAISPGNTTIKASIGELSASCDVSVERKVIKPTDIALNVTEIKLIEGEFFQLEAVIAPEDADGDIIWSSSDEEVAAVDETGKVTAISSGNALITAKVGELSASCDVSVERKVIKPTDIALNITEIKLIEGESFQLEASVVPDDAEGEIIWLSSDNEVATVDETGKVTAISPGNATIEASIGELSASCEVTVEKKVIKPTDIVLNVTEIKLIEGESFQLEAVIVPEDADGDIIWSSSDNEVATVDETGKVTVISPGNATIEASIGELSASCEVTVEKKVIIPTDIALNITEIKLIEGESFQLEASVVPDDAEGEIIWFSSDNEVATVDESGKVTAISSGNTTIKASIGELSASCDVSVERKVIKPTDIALNITEIKLIEGESFQLEAVIVPEDADGEIIWSSSDEEVAAVDETGKVTAISSGNALITAKVGELSASCDVSVERKVIKPTDIALNVTEIKLIEGESFQLEAVIVPEDAEGDILWSSSDEEVATVDETGKVTAISFGNATIKASIGELSASCDVSVDKKRIEPVGISLSETQLTLDKGKTVVLSATVFPEEAEDYEFEWTTDDINIAAVDDAGMVTGVNEGTTTVTVCIKNNPDIKASATVTVKSFSGIEGNTLPEVSIEIMPGCIEIKGGDENRMVEVYSVSGQLVVKKIVTAGNTLRIEIPSGYYLVFIDGKVVKVRV